MRNSVLLLTFFAQLSVAQTGQFKLLCQRFIDDFHKINVPQADLDYKINFGNIRPLAELDSQQHFFSGYRNELALYNVKNLDTEEKLRLEQLRYECNLNLQRISLEKSWVKNGRMIPENGLFALPDHKEWYAYYVKNFTSTDLSVEEIYEYGNVEVKRIRLEIDSLRRLLNFRSEDSLYSILQEDSFFLSDKASILQFYKAIDNTVRKNVFKYFPFCSIPEVGVMEWPSAGAHTPPGMYLSAYDNAYGKDVFLYNFYGGKHNRRMCEWLYLHEAIPGHHLQSTLRRKLPGGLLQGEFFYFGNAEGWACYIEDFGDRLGLYKSPYSYLGKLQWDLVRSARLVMETGIHYYGWSREDAKNYWKANIKGQDEIAEREITRIINWPGQALCYKIGALYIKKIVRRFDNIKVAHTFLLQHSDFPLTILL